MQPKQKQETHKTYYSLEQAAKRYGKEIEETPICYYFKIFEDKTCTQFHVFYKVFYKVK